MYNRARPAAHRPRADNGLYPNSSAAGGVGVGGGASSNNTSSSIGPSNNHMLAGSRSRAPAQTQTPTPTATAAAHHPHHAAVHTTTSLASGTALAAGHGHDHPAAVGPVRSTLLQPRVAVALGVSQKWYPALFLCRLVSIAPGVLFGLPNALRLLATLHLMYLDRVLDGGALSKLGRGPASTASPSSGYDLAFEARLRLTEALLATIWCCASGYLSFFFTDCLMSRWLLNYTPQATIVRLLTVDAINGYVTSWVLHMTGGFEDPRLILPAWVVISTTLTVLYHITQRKINIRKETSMSISVFSIASFVSMVALLVQLHSNRSDYPDIPLLNFVRRLTHGAGKLAMRLMEYGDITREL